MMLHLLLLASMIALLDALSMSTFRPQIIGGIERSSQQAIDDLTMSFPLVDSSAKITTKHMSNGAMIDALVAGEIDFGVTVSDMPDHIVSSATSLRMFPILVSGLCPVYRLDALGENAPSLIISGYSLSMIFTGKMNSWSELQGDNPSIQLPDRPIILVIEEGKNPKNTLMKKAFNKFDPDTKPFVNEDDADDWPYEGYAAHIKVSAANTNLESKVIATDGTLAVSYHAIAHASGVKMARMLNFADNVVTLSASSMSLAALELGTGYSTSMTQVDLNNAHNPAAWPMVLFNSVIIDRANSRSTCRSREILVTYLLQFYQSTIFEEMLSDRSYVRIPDVIQKGMSIIDLLKEQVMCRGGTALPLMIASSRTIASSKQHSFMTRLMSTVYSSVTAASRFSPQSLEDSLLTDMLMVSELDVAVVNPSNVDASKWKELVDSNQFLVLPLFGHALSYFINPVMRSEPYLSLSSSETTAVTAAPFVLSYETAAMLASGCIDDWSDPRILELNPWTVPLLANLTLPVRFVAACGSYAPVGMGVMSFVRDQAMSDPRTSAATADCYSELNPNGRLISDHYSTCKPFPATFPWQFVKQEDTVAPVTVGTSGGIGAIMVDSDPAKLYPSFAIRRNNGTVMVNSDLNGILACASDTYDPVRMWFDFSLSKNPQCWPLSQITTLVVRKQYWSNTAITNASSCQRGLDALRFARWVVTTDALNSVADSDHAARLFAAAPRARADYVAALEAALCDDETLLIKLPITWQLSGALIGFGAAISAMGAAWTTFGMIFVLYYRKHAAVRSASPVFVMTSLLGVLMMYGSIPALILPVSGSTCSAVAWLFDIGITIAFAPLFAKAYRIYRIFGGKKLKVIKITNRKLMTMVVSMIVVEVLAVGAWQLISPLQPVMRSVMEGTPPREHSYTYCSTVGDGDAFFIALSISKGALLVFGALLSFATRKVTSQFNESSHIALVIYNFCFTIGIIAIIFVIIAPKGDVSTALLFLVAVWISCFTGSMLVVPKMLHIYSGKDEINVTQNHGSTRDGSGSAFSFLSLDMLSSLPMIGSYAAALRKHLDAVESKQAAMKRTNTPATATAGLYNRNTKVRQIEVKPGSRVTSPQILSPQAMSTNLVSVNESVTK